MGNCILSMIWQRTGAKLHKPRGNRAAGALIGDGVDSMTSIDQQLFILACAVKQIAKTQTAVSKSDSDEDDTGMMSSRCIDGDDDGVLDSFDSVYSITGKPDLDLKLDTVASVMMVTAASFWQQRFFVLQS